MPLFGSDSNIILIKPNKQLSFQELRSRLESSTKLLQDSIRIRETQLTTFHDCLVSSAWEEELEQKVKFLKNSLNLLNLCVKEDSGSSSSSSSQVISIQNQLEALRHTERGLVAHNCYLKMKKARLNLSLVTIMVYISSTVTLQ